MDKKGLMIFGTIGSIILGFIPTLIIWCTEKENLTDREKEVIKKLLNWELTALIICSSTPIIHVAALLVPVVWIYNIVISIIAYNALETTSEFKVVAFNFIK